MAVGIRSILGSELTGLNPTDRLTAARHRDDGSL